VKAVPALVCGSSVFFSIALDQTADEGDGEKQQLFKKRLAPYYGRRPKGILMEALSLFLENP